MKFIYQSLFCVLILNSSIAQANLTPPQSKPIHNSALFIQVSQTHFVQFFSSGNATKAEGMKNTLKLQGYPAFVAINIPRQTKRPFYQVQIGPFATRDLALRAKTQVIKTYPQYHFLNDAILKTSL